MLVSRLALFKYVPVVKIRTSHSIVLPSDRTTPFIFFVSSSTDKSSTIASMTVKCTLGISDYKT